MYIHAHMMRAQDEAKIAGSARVDAALSSCFCQWHFQTSWSLQGRLTPFHFPVVVLLTFRCVQSSPTITSSARVTANSVRSMVLPAKCFGRRTRPLAVS